MKEPNKTPEKEPNEMEISNLSNAEFKTLVRMLRELIGYFNAIKKDPGRNVVRYITIHYIKWNKKNLQGTNSGGDEAQNQMNNLEHKEWKSIQSEQ